MVLSTQDIAERFPTKDAIITLVAEDTEFQVHKCLLAAASPFFADMFTLPQPDAAAAKEPIVLTESRVVMEHILQYLYPVTDPVITDLDMLVAILTAATKYEFNQITNTLRHALVAPDFLTKYPLRVFAIACRFDFEEEARLASQRTLDTNLMDSPLSDDLKHINAYSYHRLISLHRDRSRKAGDLLKSARTAISSKLSPCAQCSSASFSCSLPRWWVEFEKQACEELIRRPATDVIFSLEFLANVAAHCGCARCPSSLLSSHGFMQSLKAKLDELPATI